MRSRASRSRFSSRLCLGGFFVASALFVTTDAASEELPFPFSHDSAEVRVRTEGSYERASIDGEHLFPDLEWKLHVTERVMGAPWIGDFDADGYFNLIAADVGGKVWIWDLDEPYSAGKVEWGEHGHDARNTFTYVSGSSRVAAPPRGNRVRLDQNFPNPFNPRTSIRYVLRERGEVQLSIFDVGGRLVRQLVDEAMPPGEHVVVWDGTNEAGLALPSGMYFYQVSASGVRLSRKLLLVK